MSDEAVSLWTNTHIYINKDITLKEAFKENIV